MDKLDGQQNDPRIRRLLAHARRLGAPRVEEQEWARIEARVFDALEPRSATPRTARSRIRPALAFAMVLLVAVGGAFLWRRLTRPGAATDMPLAGKLILQGVVETRPKQPGSGAAGHAWTRLADHMELREGWEVRTAEDAYVSMTIDSATGFALGQLSQATITSARVQEQFYELTKGIIRVQLARVRREQSLVVTTPNAQCRAVGTIYTVACDSSAAGAVTTVSVRQGTVHVRSRFSPEEWREVTAPGAVRLVGSRFESMMAHMLVDSGTTAREEEPQTIEPPIEPLDEPRPLDPDVVPVPGQPVQLPPMDLPQVTLTPPESIMADDRPVTPAPDTAASADQTDSAYIAGTLLGRPLYWRFDLVRLDTLGGRDALRHAGIAPPSGGELRSPASLARALAEAEMKLLRIRDANVIALALLHELGYRVVCLTQWSCRVKGTWPGDNRSYIEDDMAFSDYYWEPLSGVDVDAAPAVRREEYLVELHFARGGHSEYPGKWAALRSREALAGTEGLILRRTGKRYVAENPYRTILGCYLVVDAGKTIDQVVAHLEQGMDKRLLDMSYKPPSFEVVK